MQHTECCISVSVLNTVYLMECCMLHFEKNYSIFNHFSIIKEQPKCQREQLGTWAKNDYWSYQYFPSPREQRGTIELAIVRLSVLPKATSMGSLADNYFTFNFIIRFHELKCPGKKIFKATTWGPRNKMFLWWP